MKGAALFMFYSKELSFVKKTLEKSGVRVNIISGEAPLFPEVDLGLRQFLNMSEFYNKNFYDAFLTPEENTVYRFTDNFSLNFIFFNLPKSRENIIFLAGPFVSKDFKEEEIMEIAEKNGIILKTGNTFIQLFSSIPYISENSFIFTMLETLSELMWGGGDSFNFLDVTSEEELSPIEKSLTEINPEFKVEMMEKRYAFENELIRAVEKGNERHAVSILEKFSSIAFEKRLSDPLRNLKNYCIIMNTLLRKAAENGGVHPIYLDSVSSDFAKKIETVQSNENIRNLMSQMYRSYCKLVREHNTKNLSLQVQKAILYISANLSDDLSLSTVSEALNINPSYLSTLFKGEMGATLTDYVNKERIKLSKKLLKTTNLQIQTIAAQCGFLDLHYFYRVFKKYTGTSPKEYKKS